MGGDGGRKRMELVGGGEEGLRKEEANENRGARGGTERGQV